MTRGGVKRERPSAVLSEVDRAYVTVMADLRWRLRRTMEHKAELELGIERIQIELDLITARIKMEEQDGTEGAFIIPEE